MNEIQFEKMLDRIEQSADAGQVENVNDFVENQKNEEFFGEKFPDYGQALQKYAFAVEYVREEAAPTEKAQAEAEFPKLKEAVKAARAALMADKGPRAIADQGQKNKANMKLDYENPKSPTNMKWCEWIDFGACTRHRHTHDTQDISNAIDNMRQAVDGKGKGGMSLDEAATKVAFALAEQGLEVDAEGTVKPAKDMPAKDDWGKLRDTNKKGGKYIGIDGLIQMVDDQNAAKRKAAGIAKDEK